jgi:hypothetical protein
VRLPLSGRPVAPLAIAGLLAFLLLWASVLLSTLAVERPVVLAWQHAGRHVVRYHPPSTSNELEIWALAAVPPLLLIAVGYGARLVRRGVYVSCAAALALALVLPLRLDRWVAHHAQRFPDGVDLLPESDTSNVYGRGEWEHNAKDAILSLQHWTIGLALAIASIAAIAELRRRRGAPSAPPPPPPPEVGGGQPQITVPGTHP